MFAAPGLHNVSICCDFLKTGQSRCEPIKENNSRYNLVPPMAHESHYAAGPKYRFASQADITLARKLLGYEPQGTFEEGLSLTVEGTEQTGNGLLYQAD